MSWAMCLLCRGPEDNSDAMGAATAAAGSRTTAVTAINPWQGGIISCAYCERSQFCNCGSCGPAATAKSWGPVTGTVRRVAAQIGCGSESLQTWVNQADIDEGTEPGASSAEVRRIRELEQEEPPRVAVPADWTESNAVRSDVSTPRAKLHGRARRSSHQAS